jgi:hypothetical protein
MSPSGASFIPYQIDYAVHNTAKTLGFSKKKVTFKFGFANESSIRQGLNGPACRGSEHELIFIWSLATGKRQLLLDNKDVHYSESGQNGWTTDRAWQHSFSLRDSTGATFRIHFSSQPASKEIPNSRPFDLRIAGISYFRFNQIYQLGTPEMSVGHQNASSGSGRSRGSSADHMSPEERQQLAIAKLESLKDIREKKDIQQNELPIAQPPSPPTQPLQRVEDSLISFDDDPPPPMPQQSYYQPGSTPTGSTGMQNNPYASSMTMDSALNYGGTSGYGPSFATSNSSTTDSFYGGAQPTSSGMASSFSNYSSSSNVVSGSMSQIPATSSMTNNPYGSQASTYGTNPYAQPPSTTNPYAQPPSTMNPYAPPSTATDSTFSGALTPYGGNNSAPNPYVDATGRLAVGTDPGSLGGIGGMSNPATNAYGFVSQPPVPSQYQYPNSNTNTAASLTSPSNQSYGAQSTASQFSYGSAPSFAQPPQYQYPQGGAGGGYGYESTASMPPSPYGAPPAPPTYPSFSTTPQQQQPSYGGAYGGY